MEAGASRCSIRELFSVLSRHSIVGVVNPMTTSRVRITVPGVAGIKVAGRIDGRPVFDLASARPTGRVWIRSSGARRCRTGACSSRGAAGVGIL